MKKFIENKPVVNEWHTILSKEQIIAAIKKYVMENNLEITSVELSSKNLSAEVKGTKIPNAQDPLRPRRDTYGPQSTRVR